MVAPCASRNWTLMSCPFRLTEGAQRGGEASVKVASRRERRKRPDGRAHHGDTEDPEDHRERQDRVVLRPLRLRVFLLH
jgi:hypothetical protein